MPPPAPVHRMAVMGIPSPSAEARAAEERKEKKKKKLEEKKAAHRCAIEKKRLQKKEKMEKDKKKKEDKKKEVHYYIFYISLWPPFLLPSQEPKKVKAEAMKKEEDPESILMNLISMPSGSSLPFLTFPSSIQRERVRRRRRLLGKGCGVCWCCVLRGGVARCGAVQAVAVAVLRGFYYLWYLSLYFLPDYYPLYFYPSFLVVRVCVCFLKMGLKNMCRKVRGGMSIEPQG